MAVVGNRHKEQQLRKHLSHASNSHTRQHASLQHQQQQALVHVQSSCSSHKQHHQQQHARLLPPAQVSAPCHMQSWVLPSQTRSLALLLLPAVVVVVAAASQQLLMQQVNHRHQQVLRSQQEGAAASCPLCRCRSHIFACRQPPPMLLQQLLVLRV
jgi:hypothetical protein